MWEKIAQKYDNTHFLEWSKAIKNPNYLIESIRGKKSIVVGWSLGAMCAMEAFDKGASMSALLLISSSAKMVRDVAYFGVSEAVLESMKERLKKGDSAILENFLKNVAYPLEPSLRSCKFEGSELIEGLSYLQRFDMRNSLKKIDIPVSILHGAQDRIIPISQGKTVANSIKGSRFLCIESVGHDLFSTCSDKIVDELDRLICDI